MQCIAGDRKDLQPFQGLQCNRWDMSQAIVIQEQFFQCIQSDEGIIIDSRDMIE